MAPGHRGSFGPAPTVVVISRQPIRRQKLRRQRFRQKHPKTERINSPHTVSQPSKTQVSGRLATHHLR